MVCWARPVPGVVFDPLHAHSTVDRQTYAGNEPGCIGGQENHGIGHLGLFTEPAEWSQSNDVADR